MKSKLAALGAILALLLISHVDATVFKASSYGAKADGSTDNSAVIRNAVAAASGNTLNFDVTNGVYAFSGSQGYDGNTTAVLLSNPITVTCAPGVVLKSTNTSLQFIFTASSSNVTIGGAQGQGCIIDSAGVRFDGVPNPGQQINNSTFSYNTVQNLTAPGVNQGLLLDGLLGNVNFSYNLFENIWQGGYSNFTTEASMFPNGCSSTDNGCDIPGSAMVFYGIPTSGEIGFNIMDHISGDAGDMPGIADMAYCSGLNTGTNLGNFTFEGNEFKNDHKMSFETGSSASCSSPNFSLRAMTNPLWRNNFFHDPWPWTYWLQYGYSLVLNGTIGFEADNNTSLMSATTCFGNHTGIGFELAFNTGNMTGNVVKSVANDGCSQQIGWAGYLTEGNYDSKSDTGIARYGQYTNNIQCGPGGSQGVSLEEPGGDGYGDYPPPLQLTANAFSETCANQTPSTMAQSIITASFTSAANQNITATTKFNLGVVSNLSVGFVQFFLDNATTPFATQYLQDANSAFTPANPQWTYHASVNPSTLTNGTHTLKALVVDVSGIPRGPNPSTLTFGSAGTATATLAFSVNGGGPPPPCLIGTTSLPSGMVGVAYSQTLASSGCSGGTWSVTAGSLPAGLTLNPSSGILAGTPTTSGTSSFTVNYTGAVAPVMLSIVVNAAVVCNNGVQNTVNGLYSDTFQCATLGSWWKLMDAVGGASATVTSNVLTISVPAKSPHDAYTNGDQAAVLTQTLTANADFTATVQFSSTPNAAYESQGLQAIVDATHFFRCEALYTGSGTIGYAAFVNGTAVTTYAANAFSGATPSYLQLVRAGNNWTCNGSTDGMTFTAIASWVQAATVASVGITADTGDAGGGSPAFAETVTGFTVAGSAPPPPPPPPTGNPWGQTPATFGPVTVGSTFLPEGQAIALTSTTPGTFTKVTGSAAATLTTIDSTHATLAAPYTVPAQHQLGGCLVTPGDSVFNTRIDSLPVNTLSAQWTDTTTTHTIDGQPLTASSAVALHFEADFAHNLIDNTVPAGAQTFYYTTAYNAQKFQIPPAPNRREHGTFANVDGSEDHHLISLNHQTCTYYETYQDGVASYAPATAASGWMYLGSGYALPTLPSASGGSTDAAALPLMALTLHAADVLEAVRLGGGIRHALRLATATGYISRPATPFWPSGSTTGSDNTYSPPYGARFRLKASFALSSYDVYTKAILIGMQQYGGFIADSSNGDSNSLSADMDVTSDKNVFAAIQNVSTIVHMSDLEFVDESSLQTAWGGAASLEVNPANATGPAMAITFTPSSGAATTFPIALTPILIGTPFLHAGILAGEAAYTIPYWVSGDPTNAGATWTLSNCSLGTNACGSITSAGAYTPPASIAAGTSATVTAVATSVTDTLQSLGVYLTIYPAGTLRVDSGALTAYTDSGGNVWLPEQYGAQVAALTYPFSTDVYDPYNLWNHSITDIVPFLTEVHGLGGQSGAGDMWFEPIILPNGIYNVHLLFGLTSENNGQNTCWGSYNHSTRSVGPVQLLTNGVIQAHNWDMGIVTKNMCRAPATVDIPANVTNRLLNLGIATDPAAYNQPMINGYTIAAYGGTAQWQLDTQQITQIQPGATLQAYVQDYAGVNDPVWTVSPAASGSISTTGLYTAPASQALTAPVTLKACSKSQPAVCGTKTITVVGTAFAGLH